VAESYEVRMQKKKEAHQKRLEEYER